MKKKKRWAHTINSANSSVESVVSVATNLETKDAPKIKMKMKKITRKQKNMKIKTEKSMVFATMVVRRGT